MTHPLLARLARGETLICDGATGTMLQSYGLEPGRCPEELNLTHPEMIQAVAAAYVAAGADMVSTNSFGGNAFKLRGHGYGDRVVDINRRAANLARRAAPTGCFVLGSIGPSGQFLAPLGDVTAEVMMAMFAQQAAALEEGGADGILVETMSAVEEAVLAVRAARERTAGVVLATMVFKQGPRGYFTMMGVSPAQAARALLDAGADIVGANCGSGIAQMVEVARQFRAATDAPLLVQPNAGLPQLRDGITVYSETPEFMAPYAAELRRLGVNIVGGCCGTTPDHVRMLRSVLRPEAGQLGETGSHVPVPHMMKEVG